MKPPVIPTMWPKHPASELNSHQLPVNQYPQWLLFLSINLRNLCNLWTKRGKKWHRLGQLWRRLGAVWRHIGQVWRRPGQPWQQKFTTKQRFWHRKRREHKISMFIRNFLTVETIRFRSIVAFLYNRRKT